MNRKQFFGKLGTLFLAGTVAVTAPGLLSASETPSEKLEALEDALTETTNKEGSLRVSYQGIGKPALNYDVGQVTIHNKGQTIKIIDAEGNFQDADEIPDVVKVDDAMVCSGNECAAYQDKFVKLRDGLIEKHVKNVEKFVKEGTYIVTADEGKSYFIPDHSGFISVLSPDKKFKYKFVDIDGDGNPEEVEIREYKGNNSRLVVRADYDRFTDKHFKGIMGRLYDEIKKHEDVKKPSIDYKSGPVPKENKKLDQTLDNALDSLLR